MCKQMWQYDITTEYYDRCDLCVIRASNKGLWNWYSCKLGEWTINEQHGHHKTYCDYHIQCVIDGELVDFEYLAERISGTIHNARVFRVIELLHLDILLQVEAYLGCWINKWHLFVKYIHEIWIDLNWIIIRVLLHMRSIIIEFLCVSLLSYRPGLWYRALPTKYVCLLIQQTSKVGQTWGLEVPSLLKEIIWILNIRNFIYIRHNIIL